MVDADQKNMWSRYQQFYEFVQKPIFSLVNVVGATDKLREELQHIIQNGLKEFFCLKN